MNQLHVTECNYAFKAISRKNTCSEIHSTVAASNRLQIFPQPASRDKNRAAMDAAVDKPPFGNDEWWGWDGEGEVSCYAELEQSRLGSFVPELDRLIDRIMEVLRSIENVARFFRK